MLNKLISNTYHRCVSLYERRAARLRKQRSLRDLARLDDRLLDDVGFYRDQEGQILPLRPNKTTESKSLAAGHRVIEVIRPVLNHQVTGLQAAVSPSSAPASCSPKAAAASSLESNRLSRIRQRLILHLRRRL